MGMAGIRWRSVSKSVFTATDMPCETAGRSRRDEARGRASKAGGREMVCVWRRDSVG